MPRIWHGSATSLNSPELAGPARRSAVHGQRDPAARGIREAHRVLPGEVRGVRARPGAGTCRGGFGRAADRGHGRAGGLALRGGVRGEGTADLQASPGGQGGLQHPVPHHRGRHRRRAPAHRLRAADDRQDPRLPRGIRARPPVGHRRRVRALHGTAGRDAGTVRRGDRSGRTEEGRHHLWEAPLSRGVTGQRMSGTA